MQAIARTECIGNCAAKQEFVVGGLRNQQLKICQKQNMHKGENVTWP